MPKILKIYLHLLAFYTEYCGHGVYLFIKNFLKFMSAKNYEKLFDSEQRYCNN